MPKMKNTKQIIARLFPSFAKDASPEEIEEVVTAINEVQDEEITTQDEEQIENKPTSDDDVLSQILGEMKALKDEISTLKMANQQQNDPLAKLEKKLFNEVSDEEQSTLDDDITADENEVTADEDIIADENEVTADEDITEDDDITEDNDVETTDEEATTTATDKKAMLDLIRTIRPLITNMKNDKQKKVVTDSLMKLGRSALGKPSKPKKNGYAAIMKVKQKHNTQFITQDSKMYDDSQLGREIAKKRNPHYKL